VVHFWSHGFDLQPADRRLAFGDPLAEKYYTWTTYQYVRNNPIRRIDPNGMDDRPYCWHAQNEQEDEAWRQRFMENVYGIHYNSPQGSSGGGGSRKRGEAVNDEVESTEDNFQNRILMNEIPLDDSSEEFYEKLLRSGIVMVFVPEKFSTVSGIFMITASGVLYLWNELVYDKDGRLDVSRLHYTYEHPSFNSIHNQPRKPNRYDFRGVVRWGLGFSVAARGIQHFYETTQVKPLFNFNQTPINQPDKTRVERPQYYFNPARP
jgi:hypothetical protein